MKYNFKDKKILVVNSDDSSRRLLVGMLRVLVVGTIKDAQDDFTAFRLCNEHDFDAVIADIDTGVSDVIPLAKKIRTSSESKHPYVPIIALCGPRSLHLVDKAADAGVSELIRAPYSSNIVAETLNYVFSVQSDRLEAYAQEAEQAAKAIEHNEAEVEEEWPDEEEAFSITHMLLDHYIKHNEIVLAKLRFAQDATRKCIGEIRNTYEKVKTQDNTSIEGFKEFDKMWEEIIALFIKGGLSEGDIFKIESLITTIPKDIKSHYNDLSQQDVKFMQMLEGMSHSAYQKAKDKVMTLQKTPSPLNGKTIDDYGVKAARTSVMEHIANKTASSTFRLKPPPKPGEDGPLYL